MRATHRWSVACCVLALIAWSASSAETTARTAVTAAPAPVKTVDEARARLSSVQRAVAALEAQLAAPAPAKLTREEIAEWTEHGAWLASVRERYATFLAENGGAFGDTPGLKAAAGKDMAQQMAQMNQQFLKLQETTQAESRRFQTLSNASKARHEVALNAIRNMK